MYLKSLELIGFKSFATKTKLDFEPGLTAIVGPNGCGKSNIADAFRWVLGEQSAKALRGSKMEDCIFNGTDSRKPLGMAEVSVTFAECEKSLGTEFNEVTITRRVFRSGEGQYFINKTPCRLKDIQRMFMDTGIGTDSYSLMEQGRIDQVLSAHPEDRRTIFEEASGITKYKSDKKEAIRKLEQTEANLLRLADVIREVKRQIGSLQRQAGKARRYQEIRDELRRLDVFSSRQRLESAGVAIAAMEKDVAEIGAKLAAAHEEVEAMDRQNAVLRESLVQTEREIGTVLEAGMQAKSRLDHARELIQVNRLRIEEYRSLSERDSKEVEQVTRLIDDRRTTLADQARQIDTARADQLKADEKLKVSSRNLEEHRRHMEMVRAQIQKLREESVDLESMLFRLQNELVEMEGRERSSVIQRERLAAEKGQLSRVVVTYEKRQVEMGTAQEGMRAETEQSRKALHDLEQQRAAMDADLRDRQQKCGELESQAAARQARIEILGDETEVRQDFPGGTRVLLDPAEPLDVDRRQILGTLVSLLDVEASFAPALEAALRPWMDAVVIGSARGAMDLLRTMEKRRAGAMRLLAAEPGPEAAPAGAPVAGTRLVDHLKCDDALRPLIGRLLGNVWVVESLNDVPWPLPQEATVVTAGGALVRGDGAVELWMRDPQSANPFARKQALNEARSDLASLQGSIRDHRGAIQALRQDLAAVDASIRTTRIQLEQNARALAQKEGENQIVTGEAAEARRRLETVTWELENLQAQSQAGDSHRKEITSKMEEVQAQRERMTADVNRQTIALHDLEATHSLLQSEATDDRIHLAGVTQKVEHLGSQLASAKANLAELEASVASRSAGVQSYQASIAKLQEAIATAEGQLASMEATVAANEARTESLRKNRGRQAEELKELERVLAQKRTTLDALRESRSDLELRHSEARMRRQNQLDRIASEYHVTADQIMQEQEPAWGEAGRPTLEAMETTVAELRTKLEAMGPVNLVAIEEYKELEERYTFLTGQEQDLINSKQQLMEMIKKINLTTSEMFRATFEKVNENFQSMFARMFNGGTARLVLVNEEDVLECGIEIIARPPGKRLQNVSLLSGGERTLTAVSLLFSIYMIKPSPFCMLDELDAALDESNIGRFVGVLQDFLKQSQYVVITHNRQTIAAADILYGITMPEKGVSNIVSMKFMGHERPKPKPAGEQQASADGAPPDTGGLAMQVRG